jgi:hypothetical protein
MLIQNTPKCRCALTKSLRAFSADGYWVSIPGHPPRQRAAAFATSSRRLALAAEKSPSHSPAPPPPSPSLASADPKLSQIVDDISALTLLQAADLVTLLKVRRVRSFVSPSVCLCHSPKKNLDEIEHSRNRDADGGCACTRRCRCLGRGSTRRSRSFIPHSLERSH